MSQPRIKVYQVASSLYQNRAKLEMMYITTLMDRWLHSLKIALGFSTFLSTLIVAVGFGPSLANAQEGNLWGLLLKSHEQAKKLSFSGTLITQSGNYSEMSKIVHHVVGGDEFELQEKMDGSGTRWVRKNDRLQCILPARKLILAEQRTSTPAFPGFLVGQDGSIWLETVYSIEEIAKDRVANRSVRVIRLKPKDRFRYEYKLFLDEQTLILLRSELLNAEGTPMERVMFKEFALNPPADFKPELVKPGSGWTAKSTDVIAARPETMPFVVPESVSGFKRGDLLCRVKDADQQEHQVVFSDGLSSVSLFVRKANPELKMPKAPMIHGAVMSKSEIQGSYMVTVLGEVPEATLAAVLKSLQWKSEENKK